MNELQQICDIYRRCTAKGKKIAFDAIKCLESKPKLCHPAPEKDLFDRQIEQALRLANRK